MDTLNNICIHPHTHTHTHTHIYIYIYIYIYMVKNDCIREGCGQSYLG